MKKEKRPTTVQAIILCASEIVAHDIVSACKLYLKIMEHNKSNTVLEARVNMKTSLLNASLINSKTLDITSLLFKAQF
jgi:hypothetical protein